MRNKSKSRPDASFADYRNLHGRGKSFRKHKLYRARFEFSTFIECDFWAVSAKNACFIRANLSGSNFASANLEGANFGGANLTGVNFKNAILRHANFEGAIIDGASFLNASLMNARKLRLSDAQLQELEEAKQAQKEASAAARLARQSKQHNVPAEEAEAETEQ